MPQDYNQTMNLPKTEFPMRAGLPQSEPERLKKWEADRVYDHVMENNEGKPLYVLQTALRTPTAISTWAPL